MTSSSRLAGSETQDHKGSTRKESVSGDRTARHAHIHRCVHRLHKLLSGESGTPTSSLRAACACLGLVTHFL